MNYDLLFQSFYNEFISGIVENEKELDINKDKLIYHYTNMSGLNGIISTNAFRASDTRYLNDPNESIHGYDFIKSTIKKIIDENKFGLKVNEVLEKTIEVLNLRDSHIFIVCFSEDGDLLSQWRGYGLNGFGMSLGIPIDSLYRNKRKHPFTMITFRKVVYNDSEKESIINNEIVEIFEYSKKYKLNENESQYVIFMAGLLSILFDVNASYFKSMSYYEEKEWRAVFEYGKYSEYCFNKSHKYYFEKGYRIKENELLPYILFDISESARKDEWILPISEIIVGPQMNDELAIPQIEEYLQDKKYVKTIVKKSKLSYRT